ncbi:type II secretion system F family protein [Candidatus Saccharibacteria bacterium]|nr:MAG: type II secretion system F family protein [Candidatus Saccharibacteria bacterium]
MISAGESSGTLDQALDRLAIQQEKEADLNSKIRGAMIYPLVVVVVMTVVVGFMVVKVLPQVEVMYQGMKNAKLPFITQMLLGLSHFIIDFGGLLY